MVNLPAKVDDRGDGLLLWHAVRAGEEYAKTMPTLEGPEDFVVKKQGMFSDDYLVYKGGDAADGKVDETTRWMFLNKTGNWWSGDAKIELENYIREDPDHPKKGQVLWIATFTDRPHFEQHLSWGHHRHPRFFGFFDEYDSDDDEGYWDRSHYPGRCFNRFMIKWSLSTTVTIAPGDTGARFGPPDMATVELRVFAKGTATRWITRRIVRHQDEDGNVHREVVFDNHDKEFVDWIEFQLVHKQSGTPWALFRCRGDIDGGGDLQWECPLFKAELGGFFAGPVQRLGPYLWARRSRCSSRTSARRSTARTRSVTRAQLPEPRPVRGGARRTAATTRGRTAVDRRAWSRRRCRMASPSPKRDGHSRALDHGGSGAAERGRRAARGRGAARGRRGGAWGRRRRNAGRRPAAEARGAPRTRRAPPEEDAARGGCAARERSRQRKPEEEAPEEPKEEKRPR